MFLRLVKPILMILFIGFAMQSTSNATSCYRMLQKKRSHFTLNNLQGFSKRLARLRAEAADNKKLDLILYENPELPKGYPRLALLVKKVDLIQQSLLQRTSKSEQETPVSMKKLEPYVDKKYLVRYTFETRLTMYGELTPQTKLGTLKATYDENGKLHGVHFFEFEANQSKYATRNPGEVILANNLIGLEILEIIDQIALSP